VDRRSFVIGSAAAAAALRTSFAQDAYPTRAITVINPFPPGGAVDVVMRPLAAILEPMVQKPVVIDTKAGAAGQVGAQVAANAKPDGYTLLSHLTSISGFAEVDRLFGRQPKFTNADFIPLARYVADPCVLVCNDQQPYKTLQEFVEDAKKRPNEIIFSSSGLYGALHIPTALFTNAAGVKLRHLPTQGGGPALTAYDVEYYLWVGTFAPKGTPANVTTYLREVLSKAANSEPFKTALANLGQEPAYMDQPEFAAFWEADTKRIEAAIRSIGKVEG
jgi:tripartite-type tricarboxylate transporter receptor subunit TctC